MTTMNGWYTAKELAEHANIAYPNLWTYRKRGILPMPDMYIGNKPLWSQTLIDQWDNEQEAKTKLKEKS